MHEGRSENFVGCESPPGKFYPASLASLEFRFATSISITAIVKIDITKWFQYLQCYISLVIRKWETLEHQFSFIKIKYVLN